MASKALSLSIPVEMVVFLDENPDLSPSKMLQAKIIEIRDTRKIAFDQVIRLQNQNKRLQELLLDAQTEIERLKNAA